MSASDNTTRDTVFQLLRRPDFHATRGQWAALGLFIVLAWVGATTFIGRYRPNEVARTLEAMLPGASAFVVMFWASVAAAALAALWRNPRVAAGAAIVAGFLAGHLLYAWLYGQLGIRIVVPIRQFADALNFSAARLLWAGAILATTLPVWYLSVGRMREGAQRLTFRWGDWSVEARDFSAKQPPQSYTRILIGGYLLFVVILFLLGQAGVGFRPIRSGALLALFPGILVLAAANATAEELVFRGVMQPAFIAVGGIAAGLWAQGALFGLVHWGTSVGALAALPVSLGIGLGSVMWGKSVLETGGLGWVIVAHAMIDVAVMSAYFV